MLTESWLTASVALGAGGCAAVLGALYWGQRNRNARLRRKLDDARSRAESATQRDSATGAWTRLGFIDHLAALPQSGTVTLLCVSLDSLRLVQDAHGPSCVERLLREVVDRLGAVDGVRREVARLGPDEFGLVDRGNGPQAQNLARQVCESLARPFTFDGNEARMTCSVGLCSGLGSEAAQLLANAAIAMRSVSLAGGDDYALFDPRMAADQREQAELVRDLRLAIQRNELELYYQPKVDCVSQQITAAEALLRWHHATRGMVSPALFVPLAERHGLIGEIGNWVLDSALSQAAAWRKSGLRMRVAINVSGYQMRQDDFAERLERGLAMHGLQAARFTCEITETVAMEDTAVTQRAFARLGRLGVHVSIDDFGTGHSSLASLRRLPAGELKIDRTFVADIAESEQARTIARAIVQMAHTLQLRVVAEGVETEAQRDQLIALGCDEMQGFLFAKPMSARALGLWAMDAPSALTRAFSPSLFKDTQPVAAPPAPLRV